MFVKLRLFCTELKVKQAQPVAWTKWSLAAMPVSVAAPVKTKLSPTAVTAKEKLRVLVLI